MVKLHSPVLDKEIWIPPGGGIQFGESIFETAERECFEETKVEVHARRLCYLTELVRAPKLHALEYYVQCDWVRGEASLGVDPELNDQQILLDLDYVPLKDLSKKADLFPIFLRNDFTTDVNSDSIFPKFISTN